MDYTTEAKGGEIGQEHVNLSVLKEMQKNNWGPRGRAPTTAVGGCHGCRRWVCW